jgi:hypothetical protein
MVAPPAVSHAKVRTLPKGKGKEIAKAVLRVDGTFGST